MATITALLKKNKENKKGLYPIYLRVAKGEKTSFISTGVKIKESDWDREQNKVKRTADNASRINAAISKKVADLENKSLELELKNRTVSSKEIKNNIAGATDNKTDFFVYAGTWTKKMEDEKRFGMLKRVKSVIEKLKEYHKNQPLKLSEINLNFLTGFQTYMTTVSKNRINTIHANFRIIRKIMNDAIREDLIGVECNPFLKFKLKLEKTTRDFLTEEELSLIEELELDEDEIIYHHRNAYVFCCYGGGTRISDLLMLRWNNFDGERINFKIRKTGSQLVVKLPQKALQILKVYKDLANKTYEGNIPSNAFIFQLIRINPDETSEKIIFNAISAASAYMNKNLKVIADTAEIDKNISFHTSRHTFATRSLKKGMRIEHLSKILSHHSILETQTYAKIMNSDLEQAMQIFDL